MLIVIPSLIILFIAIAITFAFKFFWKKDDLNDKRVINEQHLYNKKTYDKEIYDREHNPECC